MNDGPQPTEAQLARAERSLAILRGRKVPCEPDPPWAPDDDRVMLRSPRDVARRTLVLLAVVQRAEATPRDFLLKKMRKQDLWDAANPGERTFLECKFPQEELSRSLAWRLEAMWVLMWAMGHVPQLGWPAQRCNIDLLGGLLDDRKGIPDLVGTALLRPKGEILDALDLTLRLDRAVDDARHSGRPIPANLDWAQPDALLPVAECRAATIVHQRERALGWLTCSPNVDWDVSPG